MSTKRLPPLKKFEITSFTGPFPCYHWHALKNAESIHDGFDRTGHLWGDEGLKDYFLKTLFNDYFFMFTGVNPIYDYEIVGQAIRGKIALKKYDLEKIRNLIQFLQDPELEARSFQENFNIIMGLNTLLKQSGDILKSNAEFTKLGIDFYRTKAQLSNKTAPGVVDETIYKTIYDLDGTNRDRQAALCYWMKGHFSILKTKIREYWSTYKRVPVIDDPFFERLRTFRPKFMDWPVYCTLKGIPPGPAVGEEPMYFREEKSGERY